MKTLTIRTIENITKIFYSSEYAWRMDDSVGLRILSTNGKFIVIYPWSNIVWLEVEEMPNDGTGA